MKELVKSQHFPERIGQIRTKESLWEKIMSYLQLGNKKPPVWGISIFSANFIVQIFIFFYPI